jgi:hypothetical protein
MTTISNEQRLVEAGSRHFKVVSTTIAEKLAMLGYDPRSPEALLVCLNALSPTGPSLGEDFVLNGCLLIAYARAMQLCVAAYVDSQKKAV